MVRHRQLDGVPLLVVCNKQDVEVIFSVGLGFFK